MRQHPTGRKYRKSECRLHSSVDEVHDTLPAAAGQQCKGGRGLVQSVLFQKMQGKDNN